MSSDHFETSTSTKEQTSSNGTKENGTIAVTLNAMAEVQEIEMNEVAATSSSNFMTNDDDNEDPNEALWISPVPGAVAWLREQMVNDCDPRQLIQQLQQGPYLSDSQLRRMPDFKLWKYLLQILTDPPKRTKLQQYNTIDDAVMLLRERKNIIVLSGAGVSVSCGIPDFRSKNGIYAMLHERYPDLPDPSAMFDIHYFKKNQRPFFDFAREIYPGQFEPARAHKFIAKLEKNAQLLRNYTQNIDTLEQVAGITKLVQCHGSFANSTCCICRHQCTVDDIREDIFSKRVPRCPNCAPDVSFAVMKPDIVFFGENLPETFHRQLMLDKDQVDLLIIMGSSMKVRPVALIPDSIPAVVPQIVINNEPLLHVVSDIQLIGDIDAILDELCLRIGGPFNDLCIDKSRAQRTEVLYDRIESTMKFQPENDQPKEKRARLDSDKQEHESPSPKLLTDYIDTETQYIFQPESLSIFTGARIYQKSDDDDESSTSSDETDNNSIQSERSEISLPAIKLLDEDDPDFKENDFEHAVRSKSI